MNPDAREACIDAMARAMDDWDREPAEQCLLDCSRAFDALFAPTRVPCPTCKGSQEHVIGYTDDGYVITDGEGHCDKCDGRGTIEGPSLAEQALGFEQVGWRRYESETVIPGWMYREEWPARDNWPPAYDDWEPFYARRSSGDEPTGGEK
jgi:hypothetical protein